jgi:hypothetical protein
MHEIDYGVMASRFARNTNRTHADAHIWATLEPSDRKARDKRLSAAPIGLQWSVALARPGERGRPHREVYVWSDARFSLRRRSTLSTEF